MSKDPAHDATEELLKKYERRIKKEYTQAYKELKATYKDYMRKYKIKYDIKRKQLKNGEITKADFDYWVKGQLLIGERWQEMCNTMAQDLQLVSEKAKSIVHGYSADAYALNHDYATFLIEKGSQINTSYTLYNRQTVERLIMQKQVLPDPGQLVKGEIARGEAIKWRKGKIQSVVLQSVLQGESIEESAKRIADNLSTRNFNAAMRYARTAMTGAQSAGRVDGMKRALDLGISTKKQWMATADSRTRDSHRAIDGEIVDIRDTFSNGLEYPGDPHGSPAEVWNCRCTIVAALEGMDNDMSDLSKRFSRLEGNPDYFEWKTEHLDDEKSAEVKVKYWDNQLKAIPVKTYSGIWRQDVSTSDYDQYKNRIQGKRDYYTNEMAGLDKNDPKYKQFKGYLRDLDEFERNGVLHSIYSTELKIAEQNLKDVRMANIDPKDMFSQARKDAALWFDRDHGGHSAADNYFDPHAHEIHNAATREEAQGFYTYTAGSGGHNRPLAGYEKPWSRPGSGWEEEFYKGPGNVWIDFEGKGDDIRGLTTLIEKSTYPNDVWLQSGQDFQTVEGTLGIPRGTLRRMSEDQIKQELIGREFELDQFISTAVNEGGGGCFNSKPTKWNIYAPEGSEMLYASDVGAFGKSESEMILQRGGHYKITDVYWGTDETDMGKQKLIFDIELHPEMGYNKFQQDPSEWAGSKKNYHD